MKILNKLVTRIQNPGNFFFSGALIFGLIQIPFLPTASTVLSVSKENALQTISETKSPILELAQVFFGDVASESKTSQIIEEKMEFVSSRKAYPASLAVIKKHEKTI